MSIRKHPWYWSAVGALFLLTLFYSFSHLTETPPTWYDEGIYIQAAHSIAERGVQSVQTAPNTYVGTGFVTGGYPFLAPIALSLHFFGDTLFAARLPMVLFILLCAALSFLLVYKTAGAWSAVLALLLLATFPVLYGNGKNVLGEVPGLVYTLLALVLLVRLESRGFRGSALYILAGLCVGLAAATKPIFFLVPIAVGIVFLLRARTINWRWKDLTYATLASIVPLVLWVYLQFGFGDELRAVLFHYANPYAETSLVSLIRENLIRFFTEATPLYFAALMTLWVVAVGLRWRRRTPVSFAEQTAFVFSLLILLAYLRTAGWYRYFFEAMVLALIFAPSALRTVADATAEMFPRLKKFVRYAPALLVLLGCMQLYQLNFSSWVADHAQSTATEELETYFASVPTATSLFVYDSPELVLFINGNNYYQVIQATPALLVGGDSISVLKEGGAERVFVSPHTYQEQKDLFSAYSNDSSVGGYVVLER